MNIAEKFQEGGVFMYFILIFGFLTLGFVMERAISLFVKVKSVPEDFRRNLLAFISRGDFAAAQQYAMTGAPNSGAGEIAALGCVLRGNAAGEEELQARMDEKLAAEISRLDRRTAFLGMFGNVATLLGLLGTISGMIGSFAAVANASPADRATMLSAGISEAMNCTAFGLIVAIPALVAYAVFQNRTDRLITGLTELTSGIYNDLLFVTDVAPTNGKGKGRGANGYAASTSAPTVSM